MRTIYHETSYTMLLFVLLAAGCSAGSGSPVEIPRDQVPFQSLTEKAVQTEKSGTLLWGYYDLYFDTEHGKIEAVTNRSAEFSANVVKFLNGDKNNVQVKFNGKTQGTDYIDVDMDITIKHPIPDHAYDGYDVRGIFIGNGSLKIYNDKYEVSQLGADQVVLNADGYTRWFNPSEFTQPGVFGYTPGDMATKGYSGSATMNPYKYFGEGLGRVDDLWAYLTGGAPNVGYFLANTSLTRNYLVRFQAPSPGVKYNYAVVANWSGRKPVDHPSHAPESIDVAADVYYTSIVGGEAFMNLDISVFDWDAKLTGGIMKDYSIYIEGTAISTPGQLTDIQMSPVASGDHWFKYHVEIPDDDIKGSDDETWVTVTDAKADYKNPLGLPNSAGNDKISACYRFTGPGPKWSELLNDAQLKIHYAIGGGMYPQYGALHLFSSYFRMTYSENSDWGTSVVLMPCFFTGGNLIQGMPVKVRTKLDGDDLVLSIEGTRSGITTEGTVRLSPPNLALDSIHADVSMRCTGDTPIDYRPNEAFKLVMLSSMFIDEGTWDAHSGYIDSAEPFKFLSSTTDWIFPPPKSGNIFGLNGGKSPWKEKPVPTVELIFKDSQTLAGRITSNTDNRNDNLNFFSFADQIVPSWQYEIVSKKAE